MENAQIEMASTRREAEKYICSKQAIKEVVCINHILQFFFYIETEQRSDET